MSFNLIADLVLQNGNIYAHHIIVCCYTVSIVNCCEHTTKKKKIFGFHPPLAPNLWKFEKKTFKTVQKYTALNFQNLKKNPPRAFYFMF